MTHAEKLILLLQAKRSMVHDKFFKKLMADEELSNSGMLHKIFNLVEQSAQEGIDELTKQESLV